MFAFGKFCRICLDDDGQLVNMLLLDDDEISYFNKFRYCFPELLFRDASSLLHLCYDCSQNLKMVYNFHKLLHRSETTLKEYTARLVQLEQTETYKLCDLVVDLPSIEMLKDPKPDSNKDDIVFEHIKLEPQANSEVQPFEVETFKFDADVTCKPGRVVETESEKKDSTETEESNEDSVDSEENYEVEYLQSEDEDYKEYPGRKKRKLRKNRKPRTIKKYFCEKCNGYFHTKVQLTVHIRKLHGPAIMLYQCEYCGKRIKTESGLQSHKKEFHEADKKPFACKVCKKRFVDINLLCSHGRCHTGEIPHMCVVCGTEFDDPCELRLHGRSHIDTNDSNDDEFWDPEVGDCSIPCIKFLLKQT